MKIQLMTPSPAITTTTTTTATAPTTPHCFPTFFYSAPTTPIHTIFQNNNDHDNDNDFAFHFTGHLQPSSISSADDLFHDGKIKPLSPLSNDQEHKFRYKNTNFDSFTATLRRTGGDQPQTTQIPPKRRRRTTTNTTRISDILTEEDNDNNNIVIIKDRKSSPTWYNKWNLKNLLQFRITSEGSGRKMKDSNPLNKYSRITKGDEDVKNNLSFRRRNCCSSDVGSCRRKVSAHEMHYAANRAAAEEMRRRTYLPYKSGLLGCLGLYNNGDGGVHGS